MRIDSFKPIIVTFRWSKEEFLRAQRVARRHSPTMRKLYIIYAIVIASVLINAVVGIFRNPTPWPQTLYLVCIGAALLFGMPFYIRRAVLKLYAQKNDRDREVRYEIFDDHLHCHTQLISVDHQWAGFQRVLQVSEGFLIYPSNQAFHWLPAHGFENPADIESKLGN